MKPILTLLIALLLTPLAALHGAELRVFDITALAELLTYG